MKNVTKSDIALNGRTPFAVNNLENMYAFFQEIQVKGQKSHGRNNVNSFIK